MPVDTQRPSQDVPPVILASASARVRGGRDSCYLRCYSRVMQSGSLVLACLEDHDRSWRDIFGELHGLNDSAAQCGQSKRAGDVAALALSSIIIESQCELTALSAVPPWHVNDALQVLQCGRLQGDRIWDGTECTQGVVSRDMWPMVARQPRGRRRVTLPTVVNSTKRLVRRS
ncbi:hypothetical protein EJ03DRAFT_328567 [Teratosphaeria nubilosa]|uniref:Uncharacterized protein n=1 Tax=Teratosphaeria nubilosa TaxID=161662 RepID=A0A6G1L5J2_9PEZI|nr:hypothetical protein EJ03DRAFT_328567 [Teratosphaeria nubilosa]